MRLNSFVFILLKKYFAISFLLAAALSGPLEIYSQKAPYKIMESFEDGIPIEMQTIGGSSLAIDAKRYKHGQQALQWNWIGLDWIGNSKLI